MKTVGVNDFVRRQYKGTGKTYSDLSYQEIAEYAELELNNNHFEEIHGGISPAKSKLKRIWFLNFIVLLLKYCQIQN